MPGMIEGSHIVLPGRPPNANTLRRQHYHDRARVEGRWRQAACDAWTARDTVGHTPELPVAVHARPYYAGWASRPDTGACYPALKAVIDGLVDGGLCPDDSPDHIAIMSMHAPVMGSAVTCLEIWLCPT